MIAQAARLCLGMYRNRKRFEREKNRIACNHLEHNTCLVNKDGLYRTMRAYCASRDGAHGPVHAPHVPRDHLEDEEWTSFKAAFMKHTQDEDEARATNLWILKPASMGTEVRHVANDLRYVFRVLLCR